MHYIEASSRQRIKVQQIYKLAKVLAKVL